MSEYKDLPDSGERRHFDTGAQRDMASGKGDMASIPAESLLRLSRHYELGAKKYDRWNFRKGIPVSAFIDSALRHIAKYEAGWDNEDHLSAAAFNILGAMLMENTKPEMQDLPLRVGKNTFPYAEESAPISPAPVETAPIEQDKPVCLEVMRKAIKGEWIKTTEDDFYGQYKANEVMQAIDEETNIRYLSAKKSDWSEPFVITRSYVVLEGYQP